MNVPLILIVVTRTVTTTLDHTLAVVMQAGGWTLMDSAAMVINELLIGLTVVRDNNLV